MYAFMKCPHVIIACYNHCNTYKYMSKDNQIITRFAPSPTGFLHIGGVRTALFSYLYTRQNKGKFILRIEDTDKARNREEWTKGIIDDLAWLGLKHDTIAIQSKRVKLHTEYLRKLIDSGHAYVSKEIPKEEGQRTEVIRFNNPNKKIKFNDIIRGEIEFDTTELGDFVIARSIDEPLYHLAVVVDDIDMGITHIIRAEEHISNTPRQILIIEVLGAKRPVYAHLPLILASDKSKLSKRKHGESVSLTYYRSLGYLPDALINFTALMGWNPGTEQEIFSLDELISQFKIEKVQKAGAIFNVEKLNWVNKKYIEKLDRETFLTHAKPFIPKDISEMTIMKLLPLIQERISYFGQITELLKGELSFVYPLADYDKNKLMWKKEKNIDETKSHLKKVIDLVSPIPDKDFIKEKIKEVVWPYAEEKGRGNVLWPMRFALSAKEHSPDPFIVSEIVGKDETLKRLTIGYELI